MYLQGKTIRLRAVEAVDADLLYRWENDEKYWLVSNTIQPFSYKIISEYLANDTHDIYQMKQLRLMIEVQDEGLNKTIGTLDLFDFEPYHLRVGVGILIYSDKDKRQGYAEECLQMLSFYCSDKLGLKQLFCHISVNNVASVQLFQKAGFCQIGIKKAWNRISATDWEDVAVFQKML